MLDYSAFFLKFGYTDVKVVFYVVVENPKIINKPIVSLIKSSRKSVLVKRLQFFQAETLCRKRQIFIRQISGEHGWIV